MDVAKGGWYTELGSMWPGQGLSLQVKEVLYKGRSKFQVRTSCGALLPPAGFSWQRMQAGVAQRGAVTAPPAAAALC